MGKGQSKSSAGDKIKDWFKGLGSNLKTPFTGGKNGLFEPFKEIGHFFKDIGEEAETVLKASAEFLIEEVPEFLQVAEKLIDMIPKVIDRVIKLMDFVLDGLDYTIDKKNRTKVLFVISIIFIVWAMKNNIVLASFFSEKA